MDATQLFAIKAKRLRSSSSLLSIDTIILFIVFIVIFILSYKYFKKSSFVNNIDYDYENKKKH
jgi:hypothetical protein